MPNYAAKILNNAVGSLSTQQALIAATSNNIANVNTPGYARRQVDVQTRTSSGRSGSLDVGNGVEAAQVQRVVDRFLDRQILSTTSMSSGANIARDFMARVDDLFSLTGDSPTIGSTMTDFFNALNDLSVDPASIELRANVLNKSQAMVDAIKTTFNSIADLQQEANQRLVPEIQGINTLVAQVAELNGIISARESGTQTAGDERDRREIILQKLADKIGIQTIEQADGSVTVSLENGFTLVSGTLSRNLELTTSPSFISGSPPPSLAGSPLSYVVFDYDSGVGESHVDLTPGLVGAGGVVGGLLSIRGFNAAGNTSAFDATGSLVEVATRVEAIARSLLTTMNQTYLGPDRLPGTVGFQPSSGDLSGNSPSGAFALFNVAGGIALDSDGDGIPESTDLDASGVDSFARILNLVVTEPRDFAAARDQSGGAPVPVFPPGDGSNVEALAQVQSTSLGLSVGTFSFNGTYGEAYTEMVGHVGGLSSRAKLSAAVAEDTKTAAISRREEVSGVSLDEEFTNLIKFQKVYEASARLIRVADELLDQLLRVL
ncbi:MAG: hypothetical protein RL417_1823 [Pseudomonadota bacterium]|jgi:flagellar hook-associated protein 1 FlgK